MEQSKVDVNHEENQKVQDLWDSMADWYAKYIEASSVQGMVTCAVMANM